MKPHPDHPDLTAYALGEADATHVADWLEDSQYRQEVDAIGDLALHLQATAPLPSARLHPDQRSTVLSPPQRVRRLVEAARVKEPTRTSYSVLPFFFDTLKWAAAAALVAASIQVGLQIAKPLQDTVANNQPDEKPKPSPSVATKVKSGPTLLAQGSSSKKPNADTEAPLSPPKTKPSASSVVQKAAPPVLVASAEQPMQNPAPAPTLQTLQVAATAPEVAQPNVSLRFKAALSTSRVTTDTSAVKPSLLLQTAPNTSISAAAPLRSTDSSTTTPTRRERPAPLMIHSWSADVMASPWQPELRLLRIALQLPSDQARRDDCSLEVSFDPNAVRSFRQLGQRILPGTSSDAAAHVVTWYELQPNGATGSATAARQLGFAKLADAKFTTSTMAPFDGNNLRIMDKGSTQADAKADFRYEAALIGFGQLMHGTTGETRPALSQLLSLAQSAQQESDPHGERSKLVRLLRESYELAGQ
jgi:hypothetical protein